METKFPQKFFSVPFLSRNSIREDFQQADYELALEEQARNEVSTHKPEEIQRRVAQLDVEARVRNFQRATQNLSGEDSSLKTPGGTPPEKDDAIDGDYIYPFSFPFDFGKMKIEDVLALLTAHYQNEDFRNFLSSPDRAHDISRLVSTDPNHLREVLTMEAVATHEGYSLNNIEREDEDIDFKVHETQKDGKQVAHGYDPFNIPFDPRLYRGPCPPTLTSTTVNTKGKKAQKAKSDGAPPPNLLEQLKGTYISHTETKADLAAYPDNGYKDYKALEEVAYSPQHIKCEVMRTQTDWENAMQQGRRQRKPEIVNTPLAEYYALEDRWVSHVIGRVHQLVDGQVPENDFYALLREVQDLLASAYPPDKYELPDDKAIQEAIYNVVNGSPPPQEWSAPEIKDTPVYKDYPEPFLEAGYVSNRLFQLTHSRVPDDILKKVCERLKTGQFSDDKSVIDTYNAVINELQHKEKSSPSAPHPPLPPSIPSMPSH